jgi:enoyl-CoA hydratase
MTVLFEIKGAVATIRLNRPESRNALNLAMCEELVAAAQSAAADASIKLVLVRANGPVFCAGADLKERQGMNEAQVRERRMRAFAAYSALEALPMPAIAVMQGPAVGSGCEIAAACDFIVATPAASFRVPEAIRGTVGATQRLPRILGKRLAKDLLFTGRTLTAEEAERHGLVSRVVAPEKLEAVVSDISRTIAEAPAQALRLAKRSVNRGVELDPTGALEVEIAAIEEQLACGDWMGKK